LRGHCYEKSSPSLAGGEINDSELTPWDSEVEVEKAKERLCEDGVVMKITDLGRGCHYLAVRVRQDYRGGINAPLLPGKSRRARKSERPNFATASSCILIKRWRNFKELYGELKRLLILMLEN
jgi:hypothetical protein